MELEKTLAVSAPIQRVWDLLLDPKIMANCVPGTQSVEVISDVEYLAEIRVKISFIAARFKVRTTIVEARPPHYLRLEGNGEDASVASSMRQTSEMVLTDLGGGRTEIRVRGKADVMGRLGSFGLSVMRTKVDRIWEEFAANFLAVAEQGRMAAAEAQPAETPRLPFAPQLPFAPELPFAPQAAAEAAAASGRPGRPAWWRRVLGAPPNGTPGGPERRPSDIYIELQTADRTLKIIWPASAADAAASWLTNLTAEKS